MHVDVFFQAKLQVYYSRSVEFQLIIIIPESKDSYDFEVGHLPAIHCIRWETNQRSDEVHAACLKYVNDVTSHQVSVLLSEALEVKITTHAYIIIK